MLKLRKYQEDGAAFHREKMISLNACEMGLGKSAQALSAVNCALIICPASLVLNWVKECKLWKPDVSCCVLKETDSASVKGFVICSYHYLHKTANLKRLQKVKWPCIIADEFHHCKNWKSLTCRNFRKLRWQRLIMMTGTPATRSAEDYYVYLNMVDGPVWGTPWEFRHAMCEQKVDEWSGGVTYYGTNEKARKILKKQFQRFTFRRTKKEVEPELPPKMFNVVDVAADPALIAECLEIDKELVRRKIEQGEPLPAHVAKVMRSIGMAKVEVAAEICLSIDRPLVVFCSHKMVIKSIAAYLEKDNRTYGIISGDENAQDKNRAVDDFQSGRIDFVLCNVVAGGVGITLTRAADMLHVELPWSPAILEQSYARIDRIGQVAERLMYTRLHCPGTIDDVVWEALQYKSTFIREVM